MSIQYVFSMSYQYTFLFKSYLSVSKDTWYFIGFINYKMDYNTRFHLMIVGLKSMNSMLLVYNYIGFKNI